MEIINEEVYSCGRVVGNVIDDKYFFPVKYTMFTAPELRQIAEKLDELNN